MTADDLTPSEDRAVRLALEVASLRARLARVEALADDWEHRPRFSWQRCFSDGAQAIRAALTEPTP